MTGPERLDALLRANRHGVWRWAGWAIALFLAAGVAWAHGAELDEVAIAEGEVAPHDQVKVIQHLEGGVIRRILVEEGERVEPGRALVELDLGVSGVNLKELKVRLDGWVLSRARLQAEARGVRLELPAEEARRNPSIAAAETQTWLARRAEHESRRLGLLEQVRQRELAVGELEMSVRALVTDHRLAGQAYAISSDLARDGLVSKLEHLQREREVKRLEGEIAALGPAVPRARSALAEAQEKLREHASAYEREVLQELAKAELEVARTRELLAEALTQDSRTTIRAPVAGVVKNLRYHTIGGVVRPGEPVMEIVPVEQSLVIEGRLDPADRGYVEVGQTARAKITTYDFVRFGEIEGEIARIAADSTSDPDGRSYFTIVMKPQTAYVGRPERPISPGMVASIEIITGRRTVLEYLLKPIATIADEAFRER